MARHRQSGRWSKKDNSNLELFPDPSPLENYPHDGHGSRKSSGDQRHDFQNSNFFNDHSVVGSNHRPYYPIFEPRGKDALGGRAGVKTCNRVNNRFRKENLFQPYPRQNSGLRFGPGIQQTDYTDRREAMKRKNMLVKAIEKIQVDIERLWLRTGDTDGDLEEDEMDWQFENPTIIVYRNKVLKRVDIPVVGRECGF